MTLRHGSLFSGVGGLDIGIQSVLGGTTAWHCENEAGPARILNRHWPDTPNLGDITTIDWAKVEPVDVLTGGYPCQPFSLAGRRGGVTDERHLWPHVAAAVGVLRPRLGVFENVPGHLTLGFEQVLRDLHLLGYDVTWTILRASDVGAAHRRARLFIFAQDTTRDTGLSSPVGWPVAVYEDGWQEPDTGLFGPVAFMGRIPSTGRMAAGRIYELPASPPVPRTALLSTPNVATWPSQRSLSPGAVVRPSLYEITRLLPTPTVSDANGAGPHGEGGSDLRTALLSIPDRSVWGEYADAITCWERALGLPAPSPTEAARNGGRRLHAPFVEWLMGYPTGHITDTPGISRRAALKALGNAVVPQQAAAATEWWTAQTQREEHPMTTETMTAADLANTGRRAWRVTYTHCETLTDGRESCISGTLTNVTAEHSPRGDGRVWLHHETQWDGYRFRAELHSLEPDDTIEAHWSAWGTDTVKDTR